MPGSRRPTLRSLAAEAGVSATTVSFALRNSPEVSAETCARIQELARARGYRINPLVTTLFAQVRRRKLRGDGAVIAYLNTWWPKRLWESCNTKSGQFRGAERRAAEIGFHLEPFWLHEPGMSAARLAKILQSRGIRGILVGPLQDQSEAISFPWDDFALATVGYSLHTPAISRACHAHFGGMCRAMDELIARGYRRIGYVTSRDFEERVNSLWGAAYRLHQDRLPARDRIPPLIFPAEADRRMLRRWRETTRPDAIINALPGVYEMLGELGWRVPAEVAFAHLDLPTSLKNAGVSGVDQLWEIAGACALDLVAGQLFTNTAGRPPHPVTQLIEGIWVAGRTVGHGPAAR